MLITPKPYSISTLFPTDSRVFFKIPNYQRLYSWRESNWENLFNDLEDNPIGYFLGSIVAIPKSVDITKTIIDYEIIDGQQRITTITLLLVSIYLKLKDFFSTNYEEKSKKIQNQIIDRLLVNDNEEVKLKLLSTNDQDFKYILSDSGILVKPLPKNNVGKRLLLKARKYFSSRLEKYTFEDTKYFYDKLCACSVIGLEVDTVANAFIIFETLNNRGEPLTVVDLLKVSYFNVTNNEIESQEKWKFFTEALNSDDLVINKRFLLNNYHAFVAGYKKEIPNLPTKVTINTALKSYEDLFKHFGKEYIDQLIENAHIFNSLIFPVNSNPFYNELMTLNKLDVSQSYMFLILLFKEKNQLALDRHQIIKLLSKITSFFVRRNITNNPQARDVNKIFSNISINNDLFSLKGDMFVNSVIKVIDDNMASDDNVRLALSERGLYDKDPVLTRFLLSKFNNFNLTKEQIVDFERVDTEGRLIWTIEHVLPETENLSDEWIMALTGSEIVNSEIKSKAYQIQQEVLHKLGNLTLTGFNSQLGTLSFSKKKDHKDPQGRFDGYKNGLKLNDSILIYADWNKNSIEKRNDLIVDFIVNQFK